MNDDADVGRSAIVQTGLLEVGVPLAIGKEETKAGSFLPEVDANLQWGIACSL